MGAGAPAGFAHELLHRLKEVHVPAGEPVHALQLPKGGRGREAIIADEVAHHGAVLLLDVGAIFFAMGDCA